jgi:hypothetical protein
MDENEVHTCSGLFDGKHPQASARFLAQQFMHVPFTRFLILLRINQRSYIGVIDAAGLGIIEKLIGIRFHDWREKERLEI